MDALVQWIGAQLDEDQRAAEEALKRTTTTRRMIGGTMVEDTVQPPEWRRSVWPPARVLREIDAKRRILQTYVMTPTSIYDPGFQEGTEGTLLYVLQILALPYADRPGYQETWRP